MLFIIAPYTIASTQPEWFWVKSELYKVSNRRYKQRVKYFHHIKKISQYLVLLARKVNESSEKHTNNKPESVQMDITKEKYVDKAAETKYKKIGELHYKTWKCLKP